MSGTYIANKHNMANITHMFWYDASAGTYSPNLMTLTPPFALFPPVPAVGDFLYIGCDSTLLNSGPFQNVIFELAAAQDITGYIWRYWNTIAAAWVATAIEIHIPTTQFNSDGNYSMYSSAAHGTTIVNGITGYWYRVSITGIGGAPLPPIQINTMPYSVTWPYIEFDEEYTPGDIPELLKVIGQNQITTVYRICMATRSFNRGENFTPYINLADEQNQAGVTIGLTHAATSFTSGAAAGLYSEFCATGRDILFNPGANVAMTELFYAFLDNTLTDDYSGVYHAFIRLFAYDSGARGEKLRIKLDVYSYNNYTTAYQLLSTGTIFHYITTTLIDPLLLDLGEIHLPRIGYDKNMYRYKLSVTGEITNTTGAQYYFTELILMPADEIYIQSGIYDITYTAMNDTDGNQFVFDNIGYPKDINRSYIMDANLTEKVQEWDIDSVSSLMAQSNKNSRLWFLMQDYPDFSEPSAKLDSKMYAGMKVQIYGNPRYFSMRGNR